MKYSLANEMCVNSRQISLRCLVLSYGVTGPVVLFSAFIKGYVFLFAVFIIFFGVNDIIVCKFTNYYCGHVLFMQYLCVCLSGKLTVL